MSINAATTGVEAAVAPGRPRWVPPPRWALWSLPPWAVYYVLAINGLAALSTIVTVLVLPLTQQHLNFGAILVVGWLLYGELSRGIERIGRLHAGVPHINLGSVWMFAAALLTHPALITLLAVAVFAHPWFRIRHHLVYRRTFSASAGALSLHVATFVTMTALGPFAQAQRTVGTFVVVVTAGGVFLLLNTLLMCGAIALATRTPRLRTVLAKPEDYALEAATIGLGILLAWALADWPIALLLIFGVSLTLHRNVLIRQLRDQARTDPKTGLLNAATWRMYAETELSRAAREQRPVGLLMLDLDHFKAINDGYGHLIADQVLSAAATAITAEVREHDPVGRFGGDEFVVLLPGSGPAATREVAERLRSRIAGLALPGNPFPVGLSVSIGASTYPDVASSLDELLQAADNALLVAKDQGRDQVQVVYGHALAQPNGEGPPGQA